MNIQEAKYVKDLDNKNKSIDATVDGACPVFEKANYKSLFFG